MRIVTNKELSSYKILPFDLYDENKGRIFKAGEVLTSGKLIMLKNYVKIYTEEYNNAKSIENKKQIDKKTPSRFLNFSYDDPAYSEFETVVNKYGYLKADTQVRIKYFYKRILDLLIQGYYEEGLLKLNILIEILKTEFFKQMNKSCEGSKIRFLGEYEICHPLNVAVLSGLIAKKLDYSLLSVEQVMLAGLLHDIGKLEIALTNSQALITKNEEEIKSHPVIGYRMIREKFNLPEEIAKVALEHHENNDGSGYPQGLSSDYISEYSQIINVSNYYDNLAFNHTSVLVENNKEVLRKMLGIGAERFSAKILYTFIHMFNYDDSKNFNDMVL